MKTWMRILIGAGGVLVLAALLTFGVAWLHAWVNQESATVQVDVDSWPQESLVGDTVTARLAVTCPWGVAPAEVICPAPKGLVSYGEPQIQWQTLGWAVSDYNVDIRMRAVAPGDTEALPVTVNFASFGGKKPQPQHAELPPLKIVRSDTVAPGSTLPIAGRLTPEETATAMGYGWLLALAGVVALALLAWALTRRNSSTEEFVPPWTKAEREVRALREQVKQNRNLNSCLNRLTDVVRQYLEERFYLRSTRQTTAEFLQILNEKNSPLTQEQREKLVQFMTAADLVKFAGQQADAMLLNPALDEAEALIAETTPKAEDETASTLEPEVSHV